MQCNGERIVETPYDILIVALDPDDGPPSTKSTVISWPILVAAMMRPVANCLKVLFKLVAACVVRDKGAQTGRTGRLMNPQMKCYADPSP
jgi:hypothetical protein